MNCRAFLDKDILILENTCIRRTFLWNTGQLIARTLEIPETHQVLQLANGEPDFLLPGMDAASCDNVATLAVVEHPATPRRGAFLEATIETRIDELEIRRQFRIFPDCPAISSLLFLRGRSSLTSWRGATGPQTGNQENIENVAALDVAPPPAPRNESLQFANPAHRRLRCVQFYDCTDRRNNLVREWDVVPYHAPLYLRGNLLLAVDVLDSFGFFLLREAPCSDRQLAPPAYDFMVARHHVAACGIGVEPGDLDPRRWTRCYGVTLGVGSGEISVQDALRNYQHCQRTLLPERDEMILVNTWGDRSQDASLSEAFVLKELEACARLGVSHLQLDDGWQKGQSSNSATAGGSLDKIWEQEDYWDVHPQRFPRGLAPVMEAARQRNIEICLWFNPSADQGYAAWRQDAETLSRLHRQHGIRIFKIDGVRLPSITADRNFRAMLEQVNTETHDQVVFNLDMTAGQRWGYHLGTEYGNIFVENRYTDWSNYYPHWTLRNLWQLARYVPPQKLQMEFLNLRRNPDKYSETDPLRPQNIPFDYAFALTLMAQPLAWFEAQNLPTEAFTALAPLIQCCRRELPAIHAGRIFPLGEEPSGISWTGFQSIATEQRGWLLVLREWNQRPNFALAMRGIAANQSVRVEKIIGVGPDTQTLRTDAESRLALSLPAPFSFALYRYTVTAG